MATMYKPKLQLKKYEDDSSECLYERKKEDETAEAAFGLGIGGNTMMTDTMQTIDQKGVERLSKDDILKMLEEV